MDEIKAKYIKSSKSDSLAAHVVAYRVIGIDKEMAVACMQELALRRDNGEDFDYESYIEEKVAEMPKPKQQQMPILLSMVQQAAETFKKHDK